MDVLSAAFNVGHDFDGGVRQLAPLIGKNPTTLNQELGRVGTAKFGLADAVKMTLRTRDYRILDAFNLQCGRMSIPLPEMVDLDRDDCMHALAESAREFSDVCNVVCSSLSDGQISDNQKLDIVREVGEMVAMLNGLVASVTARNLAGKPKGTEP